MSCSMASADSSPQPSRPAIKVISLLESSSPHMGEGDWPSLLVSSRFSNGEALFSISMLVNSWASNSSTMSVLLPSSHPSTTWVL